MNLDVYDVTNTTYLGTLTEWYRPSFFDDVAIPGLSRFAVDVASQDDLTLLQPRRAVRWRRGANPGEGVIGTGIVQDTPAELVADIEPEPGRKLTVVEFVCPLSLSWLGYAQGGGVLETARSYDGDLTVVEGLQQNPRVFGWMSLDYDDSEWTTPVSHGAQGNPTAIPDYIGRPPGWPDPLAHWIWGEAATGDPPLNDPGWNYFRWEFEVDTAVEARFFGSIDNRGTFFLDGEQLVERGGHESRGGRFFGERDVTLQPGTHIIAASGRNFAWTGEGSNPGGVLWTIATLDGNRDPQFVIARSQVAGGKALAYPDDVPGITVGYVANVAVSESQARGELAQVTLDPNVTATEDSNEEPWERQFSHGFRVQEVGRLVDELRDFVCEPHMDPNTNVLRLYNRRGQDRSGDITVTAPYGLSLTGRGIQATRMFYETQGGFGRAVNAPAEATLGLVMASVAQFGTSPGPDEHGQPVLDRLLEDGRVSNELEILLPDDIVPYEDVFLGDTVTCVSALDESEGPVRLTSFSMELDDGGDEVWAATGMPS